MSLGVTGMTLIIPPQHRIDAVFNSRELTKEQRYQIALIYGIPMFEARKLKRDPLEELKMFAFEHNLDALEHEICKIIVTWRSDLAGPGRLKKIKEYVDILADSPNRRPQFDRHEVEATKEKMVYAHTGL
jgi:hypothetical protein